MNYVEMSSGALKTFSQANSAEKKPKVLMKPTQDVFRHQIIASIILWQSCIDLRITQKADVGDRSHSKDIRIPVV